MLTENPVHFHRGYGGGLFAVDGEERGELACSYGVGGHLRSLPSGRSLLHNLKTEDVTELYLFNCFCCMEQLSL